MPWGPAAPVQGRASAWAQRRFTEVFGQGAEVVRVLGRRARRMEGSTQEATGQEWRLMTMKMMIIRRLKTP